MPIPLQCSCGRRLNLADNLCGKRIKCPECAAILTVPTAQISSSAKNQVAKIQPTEVQLTETGKPTEEKPAEKKNKPVIVSGSSVSAEVERTAPPRPPADKVAAKPSKQPAAKSSNQPSVKPSASPKPSAPRNPPTNAPRTRQPRREPEEYDEDLFSDVPISGGLLASSETSTHRYRGRRRSSSWLLIGGGGAGLVLVLVIGVVLFSFMGGDQPVSAFTPEAAVAVSKLDPPSHPPLNTPVGNGVMTGFTSYQNAFVAGGTTQLQVYMPPGQHAPGSLGCILVAPAGTNLLVGSAIDDLAYHDEALPYAEAGYLTIKYSIDGGVSDLEQASDNEMTAGYEKFRAAHYGVINTIRAIDFAETYPEVDRRRIYVAGHSSAGTLALLAAAHEPRIDGCIAYAPCSDVESFHREALSNLAMRFLFNDLVFVAHDSSPLTYADKLRCPLFLFHAQDDSVVSITDSRKFAQQVRLHNSNVELDEVVFGDHYDPMIQQGIPRAVLWLQQQNPNK